MIRPDHLLTLLLTFAAELIRQCETLSALRSYEADTWGTEFIFAVPPNNNHAADTKAGIHLFTMYGDVECLAKILYNEVKGSGNAVTLIRKNTTLIFENHIRYELNNVVLSGLQMGLHHAPDARIHIIADSKISVLAYSQNIQNDLDYFTVHPVGMAGNYYALSLPPPGHYGIITLFFIPLGIVHIQENVYHNVTINMSQKNKFKTYKGRMKAGSLWELTIPGDFPVSFWIHDELDISDTFATSEPLGSKSLPPTTARPIVPIARLLLIASIRFVGLNHGCYMPTPMIVNQCALLTIPDYHPTYTKNGRLQMITAPTPKCSPEPILVNTSLTSYKEIKVNWNQTARIIEMEKQMHEESTFIVSSKTTIMNIVRVDRRIIGFIHEIPAYSQWVSGVTVFLVPHGGASVIVIADDCEEKVILHYVEFDDPKLQNLTFKSFQDLNTNISLCISSNDLDEGIYRIVMNPITDGHYIVFVYNHDSSGFINSGYVSAINLHRISSPIFAMQPQNFSTRDYTPAKLAVRRDTVMANKLTCSQYTPCSEMSTFLYIICIWILFRNE